MRRAVLAPSIISADYGRFADQLRAVEASASRWHVDVMDGHYVPNLTIGPDFVRTIAAVSSLPQDVHLMIANPDSTWQWYADAGASRITFHAETTDDPAGLLQTITSAGLGAGLAVNPDVPASAIVDHLRLVDHVVVMSVYPGFSGQRFIPEVVPKLRELRRLVDEAGLQVQLIVDGGVNRQTAPECLAAGADVLVAASAIFGDPDPAGAAAALSELAAPARAQP